MRLNGLGVSPGIGIGRAVVLRRGRTVGEVVPTTDNVEQLVAWIVGALERIGTDDTTKRPTGGDQ